ncbi:MAG TPA: hypothetical protein VNA13_03720 [Xanthomonadales bacterium]|nr:hypothetical protein [Xanthomonadales bacterium]
MKQTILTIILIVSIVTIVVAFNIVSKLMKDQAIDGCNQAGRIEFTNGAGQKANVPDNYWFDDCMVKKGYQKAEKK